MVEAPPAQAPALEEDPAERFWSNDDLVLRALVRVPFVCHGTLRAASRRVNFLLRSDDFRKQRLDFGLAEYGVVVAGVCGDDRETADCRRMLLNGQWRPAPAGFLGVLGIVRTVAGHVVQSRGSCSLVRPASGVSDRSRSTSNIAGDSIVQVYRVDSRGVPLLGAFAEVVVNGTSPGIYPPTSFSCRRVRANTRGEACQRSCADSAEELARDS